MAKIEWPENELNVFDSDMTSAGRRLLANRSEKGNGTTTTS